MDTVFSFLISVGITAFGVWVVAGTIAAGSPLAWTFMGLLAVIVGLISLYGSVRDAKTA
jgi:heme/copper-type cytochrome/quinol oxidase subunit 4